VGTGVGASVDAGSSTIGGGKPGSSVVVGTGASVGMGSGSGCGSGTQLAHSDSKTKSLPLHLVPTATVLV